MMQELVGKNVLTHKNLRDSNPISLAEFAKLDVGKIVENIRCVKKWSIEQHEEYVKFYCEFSLWLSKHTFGFIPVAVDQNREVTRQRKLPFDLYVKFLAHLEQREQIMVKLFYLGGSIGLEDVLSLQLQDIDFDGRTIILGETPIKYSRHVLNDISAYAGNRTRGFVFIGKRNDRINHTVPYRALKAVAVKLGLESTFTFKDFVKNQ